MVRTDATCRLLSRSSVWLVADGVVYAADRGATHMDRTDATGRRVGRRRATDVARRSLV